MRPGHWRYAIPMRLRSLFHRKQADQELDDEPRDHVEQRTAEYVARGLPPLEARRMALLDIGGIEKRKENAVTRATSIGFRTSQKTSTAVCVTALRSGQDTAILCTVLAFGPRCRSRGCGPPVVGAHSNPVRSRSHA
jgi:hypothetical protein